MKKREVLNMNKSSAISIPLSEVKIGWDDFPYDKMPTYGIDLGDHGNAIEVYTSGEHRDQIIKALKKVTGLPTIVCLCGSTRFWETFRDIGLMLTMEGKIVLSIEICAPDSMTLAHPDTEEGQRQKLVLDEIHKRKIDLADEILILNVGGYIGDSTRSEWQHAVKTGKIVRFLEPICLSVPRGLGCAPTDGKAEHQHSDGSWWFWDETWSDELGPYETIEICLAKIKAYGESL